MFENCQCPDETVSVCIPEVLLQGNELSTSLPKLKT
jgi:hypothetical protein